MIDDSINSLAQGTAKTVVSTGETIKSVVNLDPVETVAGIAETGLNVVDTVFDTVFSLFD